jgi:DNA-binding transcriptional LysR family regulator
VTDWGRTCFGRPAITPGAPNRSVRGASNHAHNVDLRRLRYFLAVAEELNYGRAARRLRIAGPSLSQQIKSLEHELAVQLFERDRRSVTLTRSGAALLPQARALLAHADEFRRCAADLVFPQPIRLGLVDRCRPDWMERMSGVADVSVDTWILPSHSQAARVSVGSLDLAICHVHIADLKALGLKAQLVGAERLEAISAGSDDSPTSARDSAILIEADVSSWMSWNNYGEEFADATGATKVGIEDGGIAGRALFAHARRLHRPILSSPKGTGEPLPNDMVRRPIVEPTPLWSWSVIWRSADERPIIRALVQALSRGIAAPDLTCGAQWLPRYDPHRPGTTRY